MRVLLLALLLAVGSAAAQQAQLASERDKVGYVIGLDVGRSVGPALQDMDMAAFQRAVENAFAGGAPLLDAEESRKTSQSLVASVIARKNGGTAVAVDRTKAGLLMGGDVGRSLVDVRAEFDMPTFLRGVTDGANPAADKALDDAEISRVGTALSTRLSETRQAARQAKAQAATQAEDEFLAANKQVKGVFVTPSGLQYMVLRQGEGVRPRPGQRVKVHYEGKLLDGKVFDSSYARKQPADFRLDQVIPGWTEGVGMMPIGAKYRFWIPARLGYGAEGMGGDIPPNATLTFDVELLDAE